jgi:acetylornithine/N-succinyldiaminopimelate aminotransferase
MTGREYLDFVSGIAVNALGHCHPHWVAAIRRQAGELIHVSNLFAIRFTANWPGESSGRRARAGFPVQQRHRGQRGLIKLARLHGVRRPAAKRGSATRSSVRSSAFHGRTFGGMSATPQEKIQKGFRPLVPGFAFGELNNLQSFADLVDSDRRRPSSLRRSRARAASSPARRVPAGSAPTVRPAQPAAYAGRGAVRLGRTGRFLCLRACRHPPDAIGMAKGLGGGYAHGCHVGARPNADLFTRATTARLSAARRWRARRRWPCSM